MGASEDTKTRQLDGTGNDTLSSPYHAFTRIVIADITKAPFRRGIQEGNDTARKGRTQLRKSVPARARICYDDLAPVPAGEWETAQDAQ
jgi:hypothetical protein